MLNFFEKFPEEKAPEQEKFKEPEEEKTAGEESAKAEVLPDEEEIRKVRERIKDAGKEKQFEKMREDIFSALKMLAGHEGIDVQDGDFPEIRIGKKSLYDLKENIIFISEEDIGSGIAYFEEISHFLRSLVQRRRGVSIEDDDRQVQEFFGRIGETIGREISQGTNLQALFERDEPRDIERPDIKKKWDDAEARIGQGLEKAEVLANRIKEIGMDLETIQKENFSSVITALSKQLEKEDVDVEELASRLGNLQDRYLNSLPKMKALQRFEPTTAGINLYHEQTFVFLKNAVDAIRSASSREERQEILRAYLAILEKDPSVQDFGVLSDIDSATLELPLLLESYSLKTHREPYAYAQQYEFEEISGKELFFMSDKDVRRRFFRRKEEGFAARLFARIKRKK